MSDENRGQSPEINHENVIQPFQLESSLLRGRCVKLGSVIDDVLEAHDYPNPVAHLVAETMTLALLLSSMLKYEGIFTLQASGDGPVKMLVADVTSAGDVRACASFDNERLQHAREQISDLKTVESSQNHLAQYLGKGHIAFTVDQGTATDRYQGIVELKGASLVDCVQHYFVQSEQIKTGIKMSIGERDGGWRSGAIMLQHMPEEGGHGDVKVEGVASNLREDDWRRAMILMDTCTDDEFLDPKLDNNIILTRLFHEEGVRVFAPITVQKNCRCSSEKVESVLMSMQPDELEFMAKQDNGISMRCEFCSRDYNFDLKDIRGKLKKKSALVEENQD